MSRDEPATDGGDSVDNSMQTVIGDLEAVADEVGEEDFLRIVEAVYQLTVVRNQSLVGVNDEDAEPIDVAAVLEYVAGNARPQLKGMFRTTEDVLIGLRRQLNSIAAQQREWGSETGLPSEVELLYRQIESEHRRHLNDVFDEQELEKRIVLVLYDADIIRQTFYELRDRVAADEGLPWDADDMTAFWRRSQDVGP